MKAGVGCSADTDSRKAGREAAVAAVAAAGPAALVLLFTTDNHDQAEVLAGVLEETGESRLVGSCGGGVITPGGVLSRGVGVCVLSGDELSVATTLQPALSRDPFAAGERAAAELLAGGLENGIAVILPDGFQANLSELVRGLYSRMGPAFTYVGGGSGDNLKFFKTHQLTEEGDLSDGLAAALISGMRTSAAIGHGWKPVGEPLVITKAGGKRVYEIDGLPAFTAYCRRLGDITPEEFPRMGMEHPLGFPNVSGNYLIRDPLSVNDDESIDFVTEVPANAVGNVMEGRVPELLDTAASVAEEARRGIKKPVFALLFDCVSRYLLMGDDFSREIELIREKLGGELPFLGTLTFGEVGAHDGAPLFHNKTTVVCLGGDW